MENLTSYPAYKASGVLWLEQVPEHWDVLPARAVYRPKLTKNLGMSRQTVLSLSFGRLVVKPADKLRGLVPESFETYQLVDPGDIVVRTTDLQNDQKSLRVGISNDRGIITSAYMCLGTTDRVSASFGYQLLNTYDLLKIIYGFGSGLRQNLDFRDIKQMPVPVPPLPEQAAIVRFLDHADRRIRRYISAKRKLIALLDEQKQAIIHQAVIRGLDPNLPLKPSGVDWLEEVPEHWKVVRLKDLVSRVTSGSRGWSDFVADDGPLFIRVGNLTRGSISLDLSDVAHLDLPRSVAAEAERSRIASGDLLLSITAFIGSVAVVPDGIEEAYVSQHVASCRLRAGSANAQWLGYVLLSPVGQTHGHLSMNGGTKQGLSLDDVRSYPVLLPPRREQDEIVAEIEASSRALDEATVRTQREVVLIREFRTRLVADVVTGKFDVREAAAQLPDEVEGSGELDALPEGDGLESGAENGTGSDEADL